MRSSLLRTLLTASILSVAGVIHGQNVTKVLPGELSFQTIEYAGLTVSSMNFTSADIPDLPFQELRAECAVRNMTLTPIGRYSIYMVAFDTEKKPLFAWSLHTSAYSQLQPGKSDQFKENLAVEHGTAKAVAYYIIRIVVPRSSDARTDDTQVTTSLKPPCSNAKCVKGQVKYKGLDGKVVERKCPVCGGTGWGKVSEN